jgi:toxin CcdB
METRQYGSAGIVQRICAQTRIAACAISRSFVAQLDVFRTPNGEYLLDCQSELLDHLATRFVIPLASPDNGPKLAERLNPIFQIGGEPMALYTQFALTVSEVELTEYVTTLAEQRYSVIEALDMLVSGF